VYEQEPPPVNDPILEKTSFTEYAGPTGVPRETLESCGCLKREA
jgi:hypothetical protein